MSNPSGSGGFEKGKSGNPGGRPRAHIADLGRASRVYASLALKTLVELCRKGKSENSRLAAARELLDRGYGRPVAMIDATVFSKKLNEMTPAELENLEARLLTSAAVTGDDSQSDMFDLPTGGRMN